MAKNNDLFFRVLESFKKDILDGKYPFQSKLPSETALADELGISRSTLRKVLEELKKSGLIESRKGCGWFVCDKSVNRYIPIIIPKNSPTYRLTEIIDGSSNYFNEVGFSSLLIPIEADFLKEREIINKLIEEGHKNFILYPTSCYRNSFFYQKMLRKGYNCVFIDTLPNNITCDYVTSCNFLGGYEATKKLIDLGHKNIAFCSIPNPKTINTVKDRYSGYLTALEQSKITPSEDMVYFYDDTDFPSFCKKIIANTSATAIFASTDELAIILINEFANLNKHPAIVGFDNTILSESYNLASVNQNLYEIGRNAAEILHKRITNPSKHYEHIYIPVTLVKRASLTKPKNML